MSEGTENNPPPTTFSINRTKTRFPTRHPKNQPVTLHSLLNPTLNPTLILIEKYSINIIQV